MLKSEEIGEFLTELTSDMANRCGNGYGYDLKTMGTRKISSVYTESNEAYKDNSDNNTLLKVTKA